MHDQRAVVAVQRGGGADNPTPGSRDALTAEEIRTVTATNRMIGLPYTKYMNSNNDVDMAAAIIMCSGERAARARRAPGPLGVPARRAPTATSTRTCRNRDTFAETPAIELGGRRALELAGVGIDDIDIVDLYSCFPSAVQLGAPVARARRSTAS